MQDPIDSIGRDIRRSAPDGELAKAAQLYDFRRPDRIAKDQLRAIHLLHENFARSLASSLGGYLRAYVSVSLVSVEQLSFMEFAQCLPSPTCIVSLGLRPYDGTGVLEINPQLVFPILEILLGGTGSKPVKLNREVTEIEQSVLDGLYRLVLRDLKDSWHAVASLEFTVESHESESQFLKMLAPGEAVVAVSLEIRIGENVGMMNIGIPSIIVKMLRQKLDQNWSVRRSESTEQDQERLLRLVQSAAVELDARLRGPTMKIEDLLQLQEGDVVEFDFPVERPLCLEVNGKKKWLGRVVDAGRRRAFLIEESLSEA